MSRPAGEDTISLVLRTISAPGRVPNLRHIALRYTDVIGFFDTFKHLEQGPFPPQVARLSVDYVLSDYPFPRRNAKSIISRLLWTVDTTADPDTRDNTRKFRGALHKAYYGGTVPVTVSPIRNLRHLALSGVTTTFVTAILQVCPNAETLEIAEPSEVRLFAIAPLPAATTTLILRRPGAVPRGLLLRWNLCYALESGLFCACARARGVTRTPRIIVRSGTPDPMAFLETKRCCQRFNVELVHEPDGS